MISIRDVRQLKNIINIKYHRHNDIINTNRRINWKPGVTFNGGIPSRTTIYTTLTGIDNTGATNVATDIQTAINNCPSGQTVLLPAGQFKISSKISLKSNVTLRGSGMGITTILIDYTTSDVGNICFGVDSFPSTVKNIIGNYTKGGTILELNNVTDYSAGLFIIIDQLNDTTKVSNVGYPGNNTCTDCDRASGARVEWQLARISSIIDSTHISFDPPLLFNLSTSLSPQTAYVPNWISNAGLEDMTIDNIGGQGLSSILIDQAYKCWIKNIESIRCYRKHVWVIRGLFCEIRDSYFHESTGYTSNGGYGVELDGSTACLVENSIFYELTLPLVTAKGGGGHVIGYNFFDKFRKDGVDGLSASIFANHGPHTTMSLIEGNVMQKFNSDFDFGSTDCITLFRNHITAFSNDYLYNKKAIDIRKYNYNFNIVGNVLGNSTQLSSGGIYECLNSSCPWGQQSIYKIGYTSDGDDAAAGNDPAVITGLLRHGNYDFITSGVIWDNSIRNQNLPNSFYLSSQPLWYSGVWPCIGPDLSPMTGIIPAHQRLLSL